MKSPSTRSTGNRGEDYVCDKIVAEGMVIVDRNVHARFAEIDIVATDGDTLCFIEVRTRQNTTLGHPLETITYKKQQSIRKAAELFLAKRRIDPCPVRFDVATIVWETMEYQYLKNAF